MTDNNFNAEGKVTSTQSRTAQKVGKIWAKIKEWFRLQLVKLKRSPQVIAMLFLLVALAVYSLNMTSISNSTAYLQSANMGLWSFITYLTSILIFVVFLNTFPKRQKINRIMFVMLLVLVAVLIFCDVMYYIATITPFTREENQISWDKVREPYASAILTARDMVIAHAVLSGIAFLLILLFPLYKDLIKKLNTSVEVEEGATLTEVELVGE